MSSNHAAVAVDSKPNGQVANSHLERLQSETAPAQPTYEQLKARIAALEALAAVPSTLTLKVSAKGAVSVYGLGKWPLTLYQGTFIRVLDASEQIRAFITAHESELSVKEKK